VLQGERRKAYRPISEEERAAALDAGLSAYARGDFFEAHELLEPAWMGTAVPAERALYQGIIKLAAGYVHAVRGNPIGVTRNLQGSRRLLAESLSVDPAAAEEHGIDLAGLVDALDARLAAVPNASVGLAAGMGPLIDLLPRAPKIR
jgi:predicted metal-dependent hydrolase